MFAKSVRTTAGPRKPTDRTPGGTQPGATPRRNVLLGTLAIIGGAATASGPAGAAATEPQPNDDDDHGRSPRYRETPHVQTYYALARR